MVTGCAAGGAAADGDGGVGVTVARTVLLAEPLELAGLALVPGAMGAWGVLVTGERDIGGLGIGWALCRRRGVAGTAGVGCRLGRMEVVFQPSWVGLEEPVLVDVDLLRRPGPDLLSQLDLDAGPYFVSAALKRSTSHWVHFVRAVDTPCLTSFCAASRVRCWQASDMCFSLIWVEHE